MRILLRRVMAAIAIVAVITVVLVAIGYLPESWRAGAEQQPVPPSIQSKYAERLDELNLEAIETAYRAQIQHLFETWMRDESGQPERAVTGAKNAQRAFLGAMNVIEQRRAARAKDSAP